MLSLGLYFGLSGALWYGGLDVIQHYTLRLILVIQEHTPANYARFLDYAVGRIFLQKVGGGYRFIHRLLLEHFADMDKTKKIEELSSYWKKTGTSLPVFFFLQTFFRDCRGSNAN